MNKRFLYYKECCMTPEHFEGFLLLRMQLMLLFEKYYVYTKVIYVP